MNTTYTYNSQSEITTKENGKEIFLSHFNESYAIEEKPCFFWGKLQQPYVIARSLLMLSKKRSSILLSQPAGTERYAGLQYSYSTDPNLAHDERILNELKSTLPEGSNYTLKIDLAKANRTYTGGSNSPQTNSNANRTRVQVLLRVNPWISVNGCKAQVKEIFLSPVLTTANWTTHSVNFDILPAEANLYNSLEIRLLSMDDPRSAASPAAINPSWQWAYIDNVNICPPEGELPPITEACSFGDIFLDASSVLPTEGPFIVTIEDVTPTATSPIIRSYYGCGSPGIINLDDLSGSNLYNLKGIPDCNTIPTSGNATNYHFSCYDHCGYYKVTIDYILCGEPKSVETIVHVLCSPRIVADADPSVVCLGDLVEYCGYPYAFTNPSTYVWAYANGHVIQTQPVPPTGPHITTPFCTVPIPYTGLSSVPILTATDPTNGCSTEIRPTMATGSECCEFFSVDAGPNLYPCTGDVVTISPTTTNGTGPFTYSWSGPGINPHWGGSSYTLTVSHLTPSSIITITVTDANGCTSTDQMYLVPNSSKKCRTRGGSGTFASGGRGKRTANVAADNIKVFPNPANTRLHVSVEGATNVTSIKLYNTQGQLISTQSTQTGADKTSLNVASFAPGIYILEVADTDGVLKREKVVIRH